MNGQYNIWNKWDKLKTVVLGDTYKPEFYDGIKDPDVKSALLRLCEETLEDLDYFETVLKDFGCEVLRPTMDPNDNIMNYVSDDGKMRQKRAGVKKHPLFPRDEQLVMGDKLIYTKKGRHVPVDVFENYNSKDVFDLTNLCSDIPAPCWTLVGKDLYLDDMDHAVSQELIDAILKINPDIRINKLSVGGHNDGCFHTIKPGALLSLLDIQTYEDTFPKWDLCYLPDQSWAKVDGFLEMKDQVRGKWWMPGEEDNIEFTLFVENWLDNWVGYVEESVFDVNVLVLDEHHVCVSNPNNEQVNAFLKKHKMEAVHIPWRHRYFHDGGLHCLTLDLYREGTMQDYFPDRKSGVIDAGFD